MLKGTGILIDTMANVSILVVIENYAFIGPPYPHSFNKMKKNTTEN